MIHIHLFVLAFLEIINDKKGDSFTFEKKSRGSEQI